MADGSIAKRQPLSATKETGMAPKKGFPAPVTETIDGSSIETLKALLRKITKEKPQGKDREQMISEVGSIARELVDRLGTKDELGELKRIFISYPDDTDVMPMRGEILVSINEKERALKK